mmetsp:Transcript_61078/g.126486  ORF Transcript_61078/g.126486 Transcript_61078/m.126486 type:complete len:692 (+) Transcript_61078:64-2139(+)
MTERWRDILHQLSSELERQSAKLRDLEIENERLREGEVPSIASPITSPISPRPDALNVLEENQNKGNRSESSYSAACQLSEVKPWTGDEQDATTGTRTKTGSKENSKDTGGELESTEPVRVWGSMQTFAEKDPDAILKAKFAQMRTTPTANYERKPWYVVNPQRSNKFAAWQVVTMCALAFVVIVVPYQVGLLELVQWDLLLTLSTLVDMVFLCDVFLQFVTMYPRTTPRGIVWEQRISKIAWHYTKTWFALDFITLIPFDVFELTFQADDVGLGRASKAIRALRLLKLMRILKTSRWLHRIEIAISIPYQQFALFRFLLILCMVCHWLSCIWAMTLQLGEPDKPQWINDIEAIDRFFGIETRQDPIRTYISSLYFCTYTMTSVGYGDIGPKNIIERCVCTLIVLTAGLCWAYVLGEVCAIVSDMNAESQGFRKKMTELNRMMKEQGLPYDLRCRMRSFFLQNRHQALYITRQKLRESMSPQLQSEISTAVNLPWISKVPFLEKFMDFIESEMALGNETDIHRACIADVSRELSCGAFAQGEKFDNMQVLYIVSKGIVALNNRVGTNGAVWGEDFVLSDMSLIRNVRGCALTYLEVLYLTREKFMKVVEKRTRTCPELAIIVRQFTVRLAVRRGFVAAARKKEEEYQAKQLAMTKTVSLRSRQSYYAPLPPEIPDAKAIRPNGSLPGSLED